MVFGVSAWSVVVVLSDERLVGNKSSKKNKLDGMESDLLSNASLNQVFT